MMAPKGTAEADAPKAVFRIPGVPPHMRVKNYIAQQKNRAPGGRLPVQKSDTRKKHQQEPQQGTRSHDSGKPSSTQGMCAEASLGLSRPGFLPPHRRGKNAGQ
ncbi:hypothetical protein IMZ48_00060 [Candidatus Bathyarchaeota archaeon]|nr:hypothetical protein [Candidatus Bathyarchaeota archaeon]